jgi:hypothetical protein
MVYRILSLDGGGTWPLIQVKALIALYSIDTSGHAVPREFPKQPRFGKSRRKSQTRRPVQLFFQDEQKRKAIFSPTHTEVAWHKITGGTWKKRKG